MFTPFVAVGDDDAGAESEVDRAIDVGSSLEDNEVDDDRNDESDNEDDENDGYNEGLVWIIETEVIQLDLPSDSEEDDGTSPGSNKYREHNVELSAEWFGSLTDVRKWSVRNGWDIPNRGGRTPQHCSHPPMTTTAEIYQ